MSRLLQQGRDIRPNSQHKNKWGFIAKDPGEGWDISGWGIIKSRHHEWGILAKSTGFLLKAAG